MRGVPTCALLLTLLASGGCGEGQLLIVLERPTDKRLDPLLDNRLARFSLRVTEGDDISDQETFRSDTTELTVGDVPVSSAFDLRLAGKASSGQMLGLGQVLNLTVEGKETTTVQVKFRKPIGYVAGPGIARVDATASSREKASLPTLKNVSNVTAVATTPDGAWLLAVSGTTLVALLTSNQQKFAEARIPAGGSFVAVSPDNRYAVVCHGSGGQVSVVDLAKLAERQSQVRTVKVGGEPTKAIFSTRDRTRVKVLVDGVGHVDGCTAKSRLVDIVLSSATMVGQLNLNKPVADVLINPHDNSMLLALPCERALGRVENGVPRKLNLTVPRHYDLAVSDQHLVVLGSDNGSPPRGQAYLFDLKRKDWEQRPPDEKKFSLPQLGVSITSPVATGSLSVTLALKNFTIFDVAVSPGGQRVVALYQAKHESNIGVGSCNYTFDIKVMGYLVVDLTVDTYIFSQMTDLFFHKCYTCDKPDKAQCDKWFTSGLQSVGALTSPEFDPRGVALLLGGS
jgi:hypothetical protein